MIINISDSRVHINMGTPPVETVQSALEDVSKAAEILKGLKDFLKEASAVGDYGIAHITVQLDKALGHLERADAPV